MLYAKKIQLGYGIEKIGKAAFSNTGLIDVDMPDSVEQIGEDIFALCDDLRNVKLSKSLTEIPNGAFTETGNSYSYNICDDRSKYPNSFKYIEIPDSVTSIGDRAFIRSGIEKVKFPKNLKSIGYSAFRQTNLVNVILPKGVEKLDMQCFCDCVDLQTVLIPRSVTEIGSDLIYKYSASRDAAIQGYIGTYAEEYAKNNYIYFVDLDPIAGISLKSDKDKAMAGETLNLYPDVLTENDLQYKYVIRSKNKDVLSTDYTNNSNFAWTPEKTGIYAVYCYMKDSEGNEDKVSRSFNISEKSLRIDEFKAEADDNQFVNSSIPLSVNTVNNNGNTEYKFTAKLKDSTSETVLYEGENNKYNFVPTEAGTYEITVTAKDSQNSVSSTIEYNVINHIKLNSFKTSYANVRVGNSIYFKVDLTGGKGKITYKLYSEDRHLLMNTNSNNFNIDNNYKAGIYNYYLKAIDETGESIEGEVSVSIYDKVAITSVQDKVKGNVCVGDTRTFVVNTEGGYGDITYRVFTDDNNSIVSQVNKNEITITFGQTGAQNFNIVAEDSEGNSDYYFYKLYVSDSEDNQKNFKMNSLTTEKESPCPLGESVCINAECLYGKGNINYRFIAEKDGKENVIYDGEDSSYYWEPTEIGNYKIKVVATDVENNTVSKEINFEIIDKDALAITEFKVFNPSPQVKGTNLDIEYTVVGKETPINYNLQVVNENGQVVYTSSSQYSDWTPSKAGKYKFNLTCTDSYGNVAKKTINDYEIVNSYEDLSKNGLAITSVTTSKQSPQATNSRIKINAQVTGAKGEVKYTFTEYDVNANQYCDIDSGVNNYATWYGSNKAGDFKLIVTAKDDNRTVTKEIPFTITDGEEEFNISRFTTSKQSPQSVGNRITILGEASGKDDPYTYNIQVLNSNGNVEKTGTSSSLSWTPSKVGTYKIVLKVTNSLGTELTKEMSYTINEVNKNTTTIYYKGYDNPNIHYRVGNGQWTQVPGVKMNKSVTKSGYYEITIDLGNSDNVTVCFNNGYGAWDSNNGRNYVFKSGKYYYSNGTITSAN